MGFLQNGIDEIERYDLRQLTQMTGGGFVHFKRLWSTFCERLRRVTVDLRVMPVEFAR